MVTKSARPVAFAAWLDAHLRRREITVTSFANKIGMRQGTVSRWLTGTRRPSPEAWDRIAEVLFVDVDEAPALAGHRRQLPMDQIERFSSITYPYARKLYWTDGPTRRMK